MGHRNMRFNSPVINTEMDQQGHFHPEPCVLYGNMPNFGQPNFNTVLPAPANITNYGMTQYNQVQHQYPAGNIDLGASSNHYNMYPNHPFPFSGNHGMVEFKGKNTEGPATYFQYFYGGSSSSAGAMSVRPVESDVASVDGAPFAVPGVIGLDLLQHNANHLIQGRYPGQQPFQMAGNPWVDQQFNGNAADIGNLSWNQPHALPYMHGSFNGGCMEAATMGPQAYQVTASGRSSATFLPPPPIPQGHFGLHQPPPPPPMQGVQRHNIELHSQVAPSSHRLITSSTSHASMSPFLDGGETGPRSVGPVPPTGLRIYRPSRRELTVDAAARQRNFPHLRILPEDGVALLELSDYHEMGDFVDHHRDMRLDIDHMSYEELLALGEQIGSVGSGLSEENIIGHLKSRTFVPSTSGSNTDNKTSVDQELNFCVICQTEYKDNETMGILDCGHEYHLDCIKKWLHVKNSCPMCKSAALTTESKGQ